MKKIIAGLPINTVYYCLPSARPTEVVNLVAGGPVTGSWVVGAGSLVDCSGAWVVCSERRVVGAEGWIICTVGTVVGAGGCGVCTRGWVVGAGD